MSAGPSEIVRNNVKEKLARGEVVASITVRLARSIEIARIAKTAGFDSIYVDVEHSSLSLETTSQICIAALEIGVAPFVRVPSTRPEHVSRALDGGALGVIAPHIRSAEEAREVVASAKYPPFGERSTGGGLPHLHYRSFPAAEANAAMNDATMVVVQFETADAIERAEEIAAVEGVDMVLMGTNDLRADLRGVDTHGLTRLPGYLDRVRRGLINPKPKLFPKRVAPTAAALDGQNGFGFVIGTRAMAEAISLARKSGIGIASARRSTHFGMAASYVLQALDAGFVALVFTNASRAMPPWGGREALLGTSPLAAGAPGGKLAPFVLDMSPAVAARGKIRIAEKRGEKIPLGYALDAQGRPTTDPTEALKGVVLPIGGPKGSGLSMLMDIFGGVLSGAAFAGDVTDQYKVFDRPQNVGHFFLAMRPDLFVSKKDYRVRMDTLVERVRACPKAEGFDEILLPGELEAREEEKRRRSGIPYSAPELDPLQDAAARAGVAKLEVSVKPLDGVG